MNIHFYLKKLFFSPVYSEKENSSDSKEKKNFIYTDRQRPDVAHGLRFFFFQSVISSAEKSLLIREDKKELRRKERSGLNENVL